MGERTVNFHIPTCRYGMFWILIRAPGLLLMRWREYALLISLSFFFLLSLVLSFFFPSFFLFSLFFIFLFFFYLFRILGVLAMRRSWGTPGERVHAVWSGRWNAVLLFLHHVALPVCRFAYQMVPNNAKQSLGEYLTLFLSFFLLSLFFNAKVN